MLESNNERCVLKKIGLFLTCCLLFLGTLGAVAFGQNIDFDGVKSKYSTKGHPKAKGINISIEYPSDWKATEGQRPNIVQRFSDDAKDGITRACVVGIKDTPKVLSLLPKEDLVNEAFSDDALKEMVPKGAVFISGKQTEYDGEPGAWMIYSIEEQRAGMAFKMYILQQIFFYSGKMITVQCSIGGLTQFDDKVHEIFNQYVPLFQQIGNSVVIHNKWEKNEGVSNKPAMELLYGLFWWLTIIVSFILTWGIGLIPPLIIRYLIIRKPLSKPWAIGLVIFFWIVNIAIFTALESQSKTHMALFLIGWISYVILKKPNKPKIDKKAI